MALKDHPPVNIFVGNLSYSTTHDELFDVFAEFGQVERVSIMTDRETGQSRGFAFVEMYDREEAEKAIDQLNGFAGEVSFAATGELASGSTGSSKPGDECAQQGTCDALVQQCSATSTAQAPCYCAAACICKCIGDPCEQENVALAAQLGTTCSY